MPVKTTIDPAALADLAILRYPDPRLRQVAEPVRAEDIDTTFLAFVQRMYELMDQRKGVGLAATQVGVNVRVFVANPTGKPDDRRAYLNPRITAYEGSVVNEEGCLSVPGVNTRIKRHAKVTLEAMDLAGLAIHVEADGLLARIFQHETDHLDGKLLIDRMGTVARLSHRATIKQLEEDFAPAQKALAR